MNIISDFFKKFSKLQYDSEELKKNIREAIKTVSAIELKDFDFKDGTLNLKCSPLERTQILMGKEKISEKLNALNIKIKNIK
jgi:hypothetical protein